MRGGADMLQRVIDTRPPSDNVRELAFRTRAEIGLFRTILAGRGARLTEAFAAVRDSPHVEDYLEHPGRAIVRGRVVSGLGRAQGYYELLGIRDEIYVVVENLTDTEPRFEVAPGEGMVSFHVRLAGEYVTAVGASSTARFQGPHLGAKYHPHGVNRPLWFPAQQRAKSVTVFFRPQFLRERLLAEGAALPAPLVRLLETRAPDCGYCRLPVSSAVLTCADGLVESRLEGALRLTFSEAKVLELICLALPAFQRLENAAVEQYSESDIRRFARAREILATRFNPPPTISSLARELAMNETKLKSGFKALYDQTVFEFGQQCRMQHAMHLLRDKRMRISPVSEAVGYQHQGTFASAFKAYFGVRPKDVRSPQAECGLGLVDAPTDAHGRS